MERTVTAIKSASPIGILVHEGKYKGKYRPGFQEPGSARFDQKYAGRKRLGKSGSHEDRSRREQSAYSNQQARAQGQKDGKPVDGLSGGKGNSSKSRSR